MTASGTPAEAARRGRSISALADPRAVRYLPAVVRGWLSTLVVAGALAAPAASARAEAPRPWLGITFDSNAGFGAIVTDVHPGTAAAAAGLQPNDEIIRVGDVTIGPGQELWPLVASHRVGARLPITFLRGGRAFRVAPRLTARPSSDEIVYQRLIDRALPRLELLDRQGGVVPDSEQRRPMVWLVFDAQCDRCGGAASMLAQRLDEAAALGAGPLLRVVIVGSQEEADAYLARVPVVGTVWRTDRIDAAEARWIGHDGGRRLLVGLDPRIDCTVLVVDHTGEVRFATSISAGDAVHDGACAAAARAVVDWRRER